MATTKKAAADKEPGFVRIDNRTKATCTVVNNVTELGGHAELLPGVNEEVPDWILDEPYFKALRKEGILGLLAKDEEGSTVMFKLNADGNPIQALDDNGDPIFDEKTGEPVFVPADEE